MHNIIVQFGRYNVIAERTRSTRYNMIHAPSGIVYCFITVAHMNAAQWRANEYISNNNNISSFS
jgi:hypothetical protein